MGGGKSKNKNTNLPQPVSEFATVNRVNIAATSAQNELILKPNLQLETLPKRMATKTGAEAKVEPASTVEIKQEEVIEVKAEESNDEQKTEPLQVDATPPPLPEWLNTQFFEEILSKHHNLTPADYTVKQLETKLATAKGDNYASVMYRCGLEVVLQADQTIRSFSFIVKCLPPTTGMSDEFMKAFNLFPKEVKMYQDVVPSFEKVLGEHDIKVKFGATCYKAQLGDPTDVIVMEDLAERGYKMANRRLGLDMEHTQLILRKMAQWHAASAVLYERNGPYDECFKEGVYSEKIRPMMEGYLVEQQKVILPIVEAWPFGKKYSEKIKVRKFVSLSLLYAGE
jgi:Ecdysteroid kinase-like family